MGEPFLDPYDDAWSTLRETAIQNAHVVFTDELTHTHQCLTHTYPCTVMICRDRPQKPCWEHRLAQPSERPRSS
jgi:hypothetical protein